MYQRYNLGVTSVEARNGYSEVTIMNDYYALFTWVMDRQAEAERAANTRRLVRQGRPMQRRLRWPLTTARRRDGR